METLMNDAGMKNKYQMILSLIIFLYCFCCVIPMSGIPFLIKRPVLDCRLKNETEYSICKFENNHCDLNYEIKINTNKSFNNFASEFKLYCENDIFISLFPTFLFSGTLFGIASLSSIPDKHGRLLVMKLMGILNLISQLIFLFAKGPYSIIFAGFLCGYSNNFFSLMQILIIEFFHSDNSLIIMSLCNAIFPLTGVLIMLYYNFFNSWKILFGITTVLSILICLLIFKYGTESPRWLFSLRNYDGTIESLILLSRINERQEQFMKTLEEQKNQIFKQEISSKPTKSSNLFEIIYIKKAQFSIIHLSLQWFIVAMIFYSLIYFLDNTTQDDIFIYTFIVYSAEFIGETTSCYPANYYGRKPTIQVYYIIGGLSFMMTSIITNKILNLILIFLSATCVSSAFNLFFIYSPELFPTNIRSTANSFVYLFSRFASVITPLIYRQIKSQVFYGSISFISALMLIPLKETMGEPLQDKYSSEVDLIDIRPNIGEKFKKQMVNEDINCNSPVNLIRKSKRNSVVMNIII